MNLLATDTSTRRTVHEHAGRFFTALPGEQPREVDTFTVRRHEDGTVTVYVSFAPLRLSVVGAARSIADARRAIAEARGTGS